MEENFRQYELNYFLSPDLSQEEVFDFSQKISNFLNEIQGKVEVSKEPKIQKLAFPLKKHNQGYFGEIKFLANPEKIFDIEKKLKLEKEILRFSILVILPTKQKIEKPVKKPKIHPAEQPVSETRETKPEAKREKVKLEEIDKKLEEIMGNI